MEDAGSVYGFQASDSLRSVYKVLSNMETYLVEEVLAVIIGKLLCPNDTMPGRSAIPQQPPISS